MTNSTTKQHTGSTDDGLDRWLNQAFSEAAQELSAGDFTQRVELALDNRSRLVRRLVLGGSIALAAALCVLLAGSFTSSVTGLAELFGQISQTGVAVTSGLATLSDLAASRAAPPELDLPTGGSLQSIIALMLVALIASWLTERAAG